MEEVDLQTLHEQAKFAVLKALIMAALRPTGGTDVLAYAQAYVTLDQGTLQGQQPEGS